MSNKRGQSDKPNKLESEKTLENLMAMISEYYSTGRIVWEGQEFFKEQNDKWYKENKR